MSKTPIVPVELIATEITDKIVQENTRLTELTHDVQRISAIVKADNVSLKAENATFKKQICDLKKELIRVELVKADLAKETDMIQIVYDADVPAVPADVKPVVKRAPKKKPVVKEMTLVNSVDVPPVVKEKCPCVATDEGDYIKMKKPELIDHATSLGLKGIKKLTRSGIIEAIAKHQNGGVQPIMDLAV